MLLCGVQYRGLKNSFFFFFSPPPIFILCCPQVLHQLLQIPAGLIFMRLLLPSSGSLKPLFILGAGNLFLLPHLLFSNIKASQFAPPNLILPLSLPPTFCKFPCIILRVIQCLVFISKLTFALEVWAGTLSPSGSAFPWAASMEPHGVKVWKERRALHGGDCVQQCSWQISVRPCIWRLRNCVW